MIEIKMAKEANTEVLALLGTITYGESHGHFVANKNDLATYIKTAFSVSKIRQELSDPKNLFYILYVDNLPVGYAKLVLDANHTNGALQNSCQLERIYLLNDFIPLKIGQRFLTFLEKKARALQMDTLWLCVYVKNMRAIRFYEKNEFEKVGDSTFMVNGTGYENFVLSKKL